MGLPPLPLLKLSEAFSRENIVNASGKLGGVAGVLAGVHIWDEEGKNTTTINAGVQNRSTHILTELLWFINK